MKMWNLCRSLMLAVTRWLMNRHSCLLNLLISFLISFSVDLNSWKKFHIHWTRNRHQEYTDITINSTTYILNFICFLIIKDYYLIWFKWLISFMNLFLYFQSKMTITLIYFILEHFYIWLWVEVTCNEICTYLGNDQCYFVLRISDLQRDLINLYHLGDDLEHGVILVVGDLDQMVEQGQVGDPWLDLHQPLKAGQLDPRSIPL